MKVGKAFGENCDLEFVIVLDVAISILYKFFEEKRWDF